MFVFYIINLRNRMSDKQTVRSLLQQARQIRQKSRTSCVSLQNYLLYQQSSVESKTISLLSCSLCSKIKTETSKQFQRAFKTMSKVQQAHFYLMNVKNVDRFLSSQLKNGEMNNIAEQQQIPLNEQAVIKIKLQAKDGINFKNWTQVEAEIIRKQKIIKLFSTQSIDLHAYIMRRSRGKIKNCIVLQSMEPYTTVDTFRLSFNGIDFQDSFNILFHIWEEAQYQNIRKMLIEDNRYARINMSKKGAIRTSMQMDEFQPITSRLAEKNSSIPNQKALQSTIQTKQGFNSSKRLAKIQKSLVSNDLLQSLNSFVDFNQQSFGIYFHKSSPKVRKTFSLFTKDITLEKVLLSIDQIRHIRRRKPHIKQIKHLNSITSERTNLYKEIDEMNIENKLFEFVYLRHCFRKGEIVYFYEKSVQLEDFKQKQKNSQGLNSANILYCIWRVKEIGENIQIVVEAEIQYHSKVKNVYRVTSQYIGQFSRFIQKEAEEEKKEKDKQEQLNEQKSIQSQQFENEYLSQISNQQQFFTVTGSLSSSNQDRQSQIMINQQENQQQSIPMKKTKESPLLEPMQSEVQHVKFIQEATSKQTAEQTSQQANDAYLRSRHLTLPKAKGRPNYLREEIGHLLFGKEWIISGNGELINVNKEKIKIQSSVLKLVLQRMGKNLLSGKSIMNMSLPIQIFGTDSNLERIARGYIYAPIFLQKAAKMTNPVERLVNVFCFGLGFSTSYIQMEKPFNPVLGETYQGIIDGCLVYGEQISHHPPISSVLMIGRGYRAYGSFEAKVEMGLNSASGINDGYNTIQFADGGVIKFNTPPGQMQGIIMGDRKLSLVKKSYYVDKKNRIFCEVQWGRKKSNPRSQSCLNDFFTGKIVKIANPSKMDDFKNIKPKDYEQEFGQIYGRFTGKVYFEDNLIFDLNHDPPLYIDEYGPCLPSDSRLRNDIIQRRKNDFNAAQDAKEQIEERQRKDKKLRSKQH